MSLCPPPSPNRSPSITSQSDDDEYDIIPDLALPSRGTSTQAPAPWDSEVLDHTSPKALALSRARASTIKASGRSGFTLAPGAPLPLANHLPHEILIHILRFVPSHTDLHASLLVSRQWCQCTVELLWHKPVFTKVSSLFKLISILSLARPPGQETPFDSPREADPGPGVQRPAHKPLTFPYPIFLRRLNFALLGADCKDSIFSRLSLCTRLERLTLANCTSLTSPALAYILPQLKHLVALDLTNVADLNDLALEKIAESCTRLQGINLSNCVKVTDEGILALARHSRLLRRVKLCGLTEVEDRAFAALALGCPLLIEMDLNGCVGVQDGTPRALFLHSRQLRELKLSGCLQVTDDAFPLKPLPTPAPIGAAFQRSLHPAFYSLPQGVQFDHLRMLDLTSCTALTDEALVRIVSNAPRIRNLILAKCVGLSQECVEPIGKLGKHLHYLHLGHVAQLTDRSIRSLAASCTRLRYIDLACCQLLTDMSVFELAQLPKLRRIGLVRVTNLTDNALFALADRHHTLERIHLSYCEGISVQAVHFLLQRLNRLTHLSLTGVPAFRRPELQQFCRSPPKEFNETQQRTFCVYSGKGVNDLRKYLASIASTPFPYVVQEGSDSEASTTPPPDAGGGFVGLPDMDAGTAGEGMPEEEGGGVGGLEALSLGLGFDGPDDPEGGEGEGEEEVGFGGEGDDADMDVEDPEPVGRRAHGHSHSHPPSSSAGGGSRTHRSHTARDPRDQRDPREGRDGREREEPAVPRFRFGQTDPSMWGFEYPAAGGPSSAGAGAGAGPGGGRGSSSLPLAYPGQHLLPSPLPQAGQRPGYAQAASPAQSSAPTSLAPTPQTGSFAPSPVPPHPAQHTHTPEQGGSRAAQQPGTPDLELAEAGEARELGMRVGEMALDAEGEGEGSGTVSAEEDRVLVPSSSSSYHTTDAGRGRGQGSGSRRSSQGSQSAGSGGSGGRRRGPLEFLWRRGRSREGGPGQGEA